MSAVLEIVKKHLLSLICLLIAIVAIGFLFYPVGNWYANSQTELAQRADVYKKLEQLLNRKRTMPVLDPENPVAQSLASFPNEAKIAKGKQVTQELSTVSMRMVDEIATMNKHEPLVADSLPEPRGTASFNFCEAYIKATSPEIICRQLKAATPPTDDAIKARKLENLNKHLAELGKEPDEASKKEAQEKSDKDCQALPQQMQNEVASSNRIYMNPTALPVDANCSRPGASPGAAEIWQAQLNLWIAQDFLKAIEEINAAGKNVMEAPVKNLIKLEIIDPCKDPQNRQAAGNPDAPLPRNPALSATGRITSPLYDVYHVQLQLVVDASQLPAIIQGLQRGRLITVMEMAVKKVDGEQESSKGLIYGKQLVVELAMKCEILYMRNWTDPLMPESIRRQLGLPARVVK